MKGGEEKGEVAHQFEYKLLCTTGKGKKILCNLSYIHTSYSGFVHTDWGKQSSRGVRFFVSFQSKISHVLFCSHHHVFIVTLIVGNSSVTENRHRLWTMMMMLMNDADLTNPFLFNRDKMRFLG